MLVDLPANERLFILRLLSHEASAILMIHRLCIHPSLVLGEHSTLVRVLKPEFLTYQWQSYPCPCRCYKLQLDCKRARVRAGGAGEYEYSTHIKIIEPLDRVRQPTWPGSSRTRRSCRKCTTPRTTRTPQSRSSRPPYVFLSLTQYADAEFNVWWLGEGE